MQKQLTIFIAMLVAAAAVTASVSIVLISSQDTVDFNDKMPAFTSNSELTQFLDSAEGSHGYWNSSPGMWTSLGASEDQSYSVRSPDYSKTNVRTEGVDEIDSVKTDGEYIYSSTWDSVRIIKAYPPSELSIVSFINSSDIVSILNLTKLGPEDSDQYLSISISGLYLASGKLVIIASVSVYQNYYQGGGDVIAYNTSASESVARTSSYIAWTPDMQKTAVLVFDIDDPSHPSYETFYAATGYPITSRLQDGFLYSMSESYIWKSEAGVYQLPTVTLSDGTSEIDLKDVHYDPEANDPSYFLNIMAIDLASGSTKTKSIIGGWSSVIYKSQESLYLTFEKWSWQNMPVSIGSEAVTEPLVSTTVYKIGVDGLNMHVSARGDFNGVLLNQFALDEKDGYLRLAANNGDWNNRLNAVYVLDSDLATVGSLENLAANESIQAARFVNDTLYLVTFRQIDPLFVIDLSNPTEPKVLGELTMPGFSSYLHPVDEDHVLGIGREGSSVKISLYDISDPTNPQEASKYLIEEGSYASSSAEWDSKAVLFSAEKNLLVIPVNIYDYYSGNYMHFDGFFVFDVSVDSGISLRGTVDHSQDSYTYSYGHGRSLYIGEYLYTITDATMKVSSLSDLSEIAILELPSSNRYYYAYGALKVDALAE
jgi:inhibitor of cysteine peptidase